jgi:hypothetical protein
MTRQKRPVLWSQIRKCISFTLWITKLTHNIKTDIRMHYSYNGCKSRELQQFRD